MPEKTPKDRKREKAHYRYSVLIPVLAMDGPMMPNSTLQEYKYTDKIAI
jgi:hypothetical protein